MKTTLEIPVKPTDARPWMKTFGGLRALRKESARINQIIEEEFERIEPEDFALILDTNPDAYPPATLPGTHM